MLLRIFFITTALFFLSPRTTTATNSSPDCSAIATINEIQNPELQTIFVTIQNIIDPKPAIAPNCFETYTPGETIPINIKNNITTSDYNREISFDIYFSENNNVITANHTLGLSTIDQYKKRLYSAVLITVILGVAIHYWQKSIDLQKKQH